jgi:hypothetical protein
MDAPEAGYTPSAKLAEFVRCRDLTCRAPGCDRPAESCDIDHSIPFGDGGVTHPSNLKCLCRLHHLLKTFWGWRDKQLPDGTVIRLGYLPTCIPALCALIGDFYADATANKRHLPGTPLSL